MNKLSVPLGLLLLVSAIGLLVWQKQEDPATYRDVEMAFSVRVPDGWVVLSENIKYRGGTEAIIFRSPEFQTDTIMIPAHGGPEPYTRVVRGAQIVIPKQQRKISGTPDAHLEFMLKIADDCTNCIDVREVELDGQPALLEQIEVMGVPGNYWTSVTTARHGKEFVILYYYDSLSPENGVALNQFLKIFDFL